VQPLEIERDLDPVADPHRLTRLEGRAEERAGPMDERRAGALTGKYANRCAPSA
jgi:hypothetical protein